MKRHHRMLKSQLRKTGFTGRDFVFEVQHSNASQRLCRAQVNSQTRSRANGAGRAGQYAQLNVDDLRGM